LRNAHKKWKCYCIKMEWTYGHAGTIFPQGFLEQFQILTDPSRGIADPNGRLCDTLRFDEWVRRESVCDDQCRPALPHTGFSIDVTCNGRSRFGKAMDHLSQIVLRASPAFQST
jgi:hypothetical protein